MKFASLTASYIIAEIGVNHSGSVALAKEMILAAKKSGADAVKFQTFTAEDLVTAGTPKVRYQESTTSPDEDHFKMIKNLEFSREDHYPVFEYCRELCIDFISTPYDIASAKFLNEMGVGIFKVASADIVDLPLHEYLASTGKPVIIATGMASISEIETTVDIYRKAGNENICLLHCVSNYPCSNESLNLRAMQTIANIFHLPVGFSDHSVGELAAALSVAFDAKVIEKHFTLDKTMLGPDHKASSTPDEFLALVNTIRLAELMLGSPHKQRQPEEMQMARVSRKSIVARKSLPKNHIIAEQDVTLKRPGTGLDATLLPVVIGRKTAREIEANKLISWYDLEEN